MCFTVEFRPCRNSNHLVKMFLGGYEKGLEQLGAAVIGRNRQGDRVGTSMNCTGAYRIQSNSNRRMGGHETAGFLVTRLKKCN